MVRWGSARFPIVPLLLPSETSAGHTPVAAAAGKCARQKAATLLLKHVVSAANTVHRESAQSKGAPPTHIVSDPHIAENMAVGVSRAPCTTAPPPLETRVVVPNTAVVEINVGLQNAH